MYATQAAKTKRVPDEWVKEYQRRTNGEIEDLVLSTYSEAQVGKPGEEIVAMLEGKGYPRPFAEWYVEEVRAADRPIRLYATSMGTWDETGPRVDRSYNAGVRKKARIWGYTTLLTYVGVAVLAGIGPSQPLATSLIFPLFILGKGALVAYSYFLALHTGHNEKLFAGLSIFIGWWAIIYLFFFPKRRYH